MRTLEEAGVGARPPFVRADTINDRPFEIIHAYVNPDGYDHRPELYCHLRFLGRDSEGDSIYDADGHEIHECSWSANLTPQRQQIAQHFVVSTESLGPCQFEFRPTDRGAPFAAIVTYRGQLTALYRDDQSDGSFAPPAPPTGRQLASQNGSGMSDQARSAPRRVNADQLGPERFPVPGPAPVSSRAGAGSPSAGRRPTDDDGSSAFRNDRGEELPEDLPF